MPQTPKQKEWYQNNKERILAWRKQYYVINKDKIDAYRRKTYEANKVYQRNQNLLKRYGIDSDTFDRMLLAQNSVCKICKRACATGRRLCIDHNHATGQVRGLLCSECNHGIGKFKDSAELLDEAAAYVRSYE